MPSDLDKLVVMLYKMFDHLDADLSAIVDNREQMARQHPNPERLQEWRDAVLVHNAYLDFAERCTAVLDLFRGDGV